MLYFLYLALIQATYPTIHSDLKGLRSDQFQEREAATKRLESLPGWTAPYFKDHAGNPKDAEVKIRCRRIYETLARKARKDRDVLFTEIHRQKMNMAGEAAQKKRVATMIANLAKLSAEDLRLAEKQKVCVFHEIYPYIALGEMGVPVKIIVKGQPILLCCKGCIKSAQANPDKTLALVKELKAAPAESYPVLTKEQMQKVKEIVKSSNRKK